MIPTLKHESAPVVGLAKSVTEIVVDVLEISELQVKLARQDAKQAVSQATYPLIGLLIGLVLLLSALPVVALGLAGLLEYQLGWTSWVAQLVVGLGFAILALIFVLSAILRLRRALTTFGRSTQELAYNFAWIKSLFQ